jgi:phosphoglycerate dehydrogenase-like enzyme
MSWKVLVTARTLNEVGTEAIRLLKAANCELIIPPKMGPHKAKELLPLLEGADVVFASVDQYSAEVLNSWQARSLKMISRWGVGYDSIDVAEATKLGIVIAYTPGLLNETVADYTFALLLALARRVHEGHLSMNRGEWNLVWGSDVHGKTLGLLGCGRIGQAVAKRAAGFDLKVIAYDVAPSCDFAKLGIEQVSLPDLLSRSDFLSLHASLTPESRGIIGEKELRQMKKTAFLINAGRGALIDEPALLRALQEKWIAGAALDTFVVEPMPWGNPFRTAPNVLLTPHLASFGRETGERVSNMAAQAIVDLMSGKQPRMVLNPDVFKSRALRAHLNPEAVTP